MVNMEERMNSDFIALAVHDANLTLSLFKSYQTGSVHREKFAYFIRDTIFAT
jgi:hypothetical protein